MRAVLGAGRAELPLLGAPHVGGGADVALRARRPGLHHRQDQAGVSAASATAGSAASTASAATYMSLATVRQ